MIEQLIRACLDAKLRKSAFLVMNVLKICRISEPRRRTMREEPLPRLSNLPTTSAATKASVDAAVVLRIVVE